MSTLRAQTRISRNRVSWGLDDCQSPQLSLRGPWANYSLSYLDGVGISHSTTLLRSVRFWFLLQFTCLAPRCWQILDRNQWYGSWNASLPLTARRLKCRRQAHSRALSFPPVTPFDNDPPEARLTCGLLF
jgi:hypothetical protein